MNSVVFMELTSKIGQPLGGLTQALSKGEGVVSGRF